ncbi:hypothetical protein CRM22_006814 [Opisthorchis felineus]|uniref:Uncharacterized protein n=1 Tax=Opisthorchis felineus TaxID=147828 RepID=A0A4S2LJC7_OPIFE|nr:hypothetical protein CRM22_006814 [Opisthorchis felineus]
MSRIWLSTGLCARASPNFNAVSYFFHSLTSNLNAFFLAHDVVFHTQCLLWMSPSDKLFPPHIEPWTDHVISNLPPLSFIYLIPKSQTSLFQWLVESFYCPLPVSLFLGK